MTPRRSPRREQQRHLLRLATALRRARESMRPPPSGAAFAKQLGWVQTKVSLIEAARQTPTEDDIQAWAAATRSDADQLLDLREQSLTRRFDIAAAARWPGGTDALQGDLKLLEAESGAIADYSPVVIPGLAQTADYTRAWLTQRDRVELGGPLDMDEILETRAQRQQQARDRQLVVAVQPAALTAVYGTVDVQVAQLDALVEQARSATLDLIVARGAIALLHGFELLDDLVFIEHVAGGLLLGAEGEVVQFRRALARIRRQGAVGAAAIREVERARGLIA